MTNDDKYHQGLESIVIGNMYCSVYFFTTLFGTGDIQHIFDQNMIDSMQVLTTLICQMSAAAANIFYQRLQILLLKLMQYSCKIDDESMMNDE